MHFFLCLLTHNSSTNLPKSILDMNKLQMYMYNISPLVEIGERIYVYKNLFFNLIRNKNKTNIQNVVIL